MAFEAVSALVMRHRDAAIDALYGRATASAENGPRIAAAVDQDERLRAIVEAFLDAPMQRRRDGACLVRLLKFFPQADDLSGWQRARGDASSDGKELILPFPRVMIRFERRRGGTEEGQCIFHFCADDGDVSPMVARRFFLLVARLLLLIHDD